MRLTLRTLLAYLDDLLEPEQAKEIGAKVAEVEFASQLVDRIKDVMRRRRLTAPELHGAGSGIDPNIVAEYLDNVLPPHLVAEVEKICLEADLHLAEVAACHQVLTIVQGEPVKITAENRHRMYALVPGSPSETVPASTEDPKPEPAAQKPAPKNGAANGNAPAAVPRRNQTTAAAAQPKPSFGESIPDYLKPAPLWKRALVPACVIAVVAGWIALLIVDPSFMGGSSEKPNEQVAATEPQKTLDENPTPVEPKKTEESKSIPKKTTNPVVDVDPKQPVEPNPDEQPKVAVIPMPMPVVPPPAKAETPKPMPVEPMPKPVAPAVVKLPTIVYRSDGGVLVAQDDIKRWTLVLNRSVVMVDELLACPEPYTASLDIDGKLQVDLGPGSLIRWMRPTVENPLGIEVKMGTVIIERPAESEEAFTVAVKIRDDLHHITFESPDTRCGLEVIPEKPEGAKDVNMTGFSKATLYVAAGQASVKQTPPIKLAANEKYALTLKPIPGKNPDLVENDPEPFKKMPGWLKTEVAKTTATARQTSNLFAKIFQHNTPITLSLPPIIRDSETRVTVAELAVKCLALVGDVSSTTEVLAAHSLPQETRMAAFEGLGTWLSLNPDQGPKLLEAVRNNFDAITGEGASQLVYEMLWGFSEEDARNEFKSEKLVNLLNHENLSIREMAIAHLESLTGRSYDYRPLARESSRTHAVARWKEHVVKNGGALVK